LPLPHALLFFKDLIASVTSFSEIVSFITVLYSLLPIFKNKGDPANADNDRGITILSCYGKLFTCILNNRLFNYLESLGLLCEEQAGFRKGWFMVFNATFNNISVIS
jgi:hypothetical protein